MHPEATVGPTRREGWKLPAWRVMLTVTDGEMPPELLVGAPDVAAAAAVAERECPDAEILLIERTGVVFLP